MVIVMMGVCGCGKTTVGRLLAEAKGWAFDDADDFHPPANVAKMSRGEPLTDGDRLPWLHALRDRIAGHVAAKRSAVVTCSALTEAARRTLGVNGRDVQLVYLKGDFETINPRITARKDHFMPASLLRSQFELLEEPADAIVVDVANNPRTCVEKILDALNKAGSLRDPGSRAQK